MDIKFSNNLFLSTAELNKLKQSLGESGWKLFAKNLIKQFGIASTNNNTQFLPISKSGENEVITIKPGIAFDSDMNIIVLKESIDISVPAAQLTGNLKYWIILRHKTNHWEEGFVNISADGALVGNGTDFLSVLRGQPDFPTKVRFESQINTDSYEVVSVSSSTTAVLAGSFTAQQNIRYSVVGTFTPGFIPKEEDAEIYEYDSYELRVVTAEDRNSVVLEDGKDFLICSVNYVNTAMQLRDYRVYHMLNNPYSQSLESIKELVENKFVSLLGCSIVSNSSKGIMLELQLEHGFKVSNFEVNILSSGYRIDIEGMSNVFPDSVSLAQQEHIFQGWYFLNRQNMAYSVIKDSSANNLFIEELNPDSINGTDIVLTPPFKEIEYQIFVASEIPYVYKFNVDNIRNKCMIPILYNEEADEVTINLRYRFIHNVEDKYPLKKFIVSNFINWDGLSKVLSDSSFSIPMSDIKPIENVRNYS